LKSIWKKTACAGLLAAAALLSGCGSEDKVAVVDYQQLMLKSETIKGIQQEIVDKNKEISERLANQEGTLSPDEMKKKVADAQQERAIFVQSKQRQMQSIVESQCAAIAREKNVGIVMQKMAVPAGAVDITDEVLARIDGGASGDAKK
jgi:hypothetical protein